MKFLRLYIKNLSKYDFVQQFNYKNISDIPRLEKIVLSFEYKTPTYRQVLSSLIALELISKVKPSLLTLKKSNVVLKLRAGSPVGCKVTLRKLKMLDFITNLFLILIPQDKHFRISVPKKIFLSSLSLDFKSLFLFDELKGNYNLLKNLNNLSVVLVTSTKNFSEFLFFMKTLKVNI